MSKKLVAYFSASGFGSAAANLKASAPGAQIIEGKVNPSASDISKLAEM